MSGRIVAGLCPQRKDDAHKGTYGKVLMITGSQGMAGAADPIREGGLPHGKRACTDPDTGIKPHSDSDDAPGSSPDSLWRMSGRRTGRNSGLGRCDLRRMRAWNRSGCLYDYGRSARYLAVHPKHCVVDADGLNIISGMEKEKREALLKAAGGCLIFTPHVKEFARLLGESTEETKKNRIGLAQQYAKSYNIILTAKDARTIVAGKDQIPYLNTSGNGAMAKAGSGDVLAGMITGCLALGMDRFSAAALGVFVHGLCGDEARQKLAAHCVLAGDLIEMIPAVLREI